jgi:hypothetical protein
MAVLNEIVRQIDTLNRQIDRLSAVETGASSASSGAPTNAQYVTLATNALLTAERVLVASSGLNLTDGGAGGNASLNVSIGNGLDFSSGSVVVDETELTHDSLGGLTTDNHHAQSHVLATTTGLGADHTVAGLTAGQYLRASGATTACFNTIPDGDLPSTIVRTSRILTAGAGLTGGGDLSADRTFNVGSGSGITVNADDIQVVTSSGLTLTAASGVALTTPGTLSTSTTNTPQGNHTHAMTSSSDGATNTDTILRSSDGGDLALRSLLVSGCVIRSGDPDTLIALTDDAMTFTAGNETLLTLTETSQDVVKIGDGGDVDINFNDQMFMQGSSGNFGIGVNPPAAVLHISDDTAVGQPEIRFVSSSADGSPFITFYQEATRRAFVRSNDSEDALDLAAQYGPVVILTGSAGSESERMRVEADGKVGIGTASPTVKLEVITDSAITAQFQRSEDTTGGAGIQFRKSRGTSSSPSIIQNDDFLTGFETKGYDGSNFITAANITVGVDGVPGTNDMPGRITFWTTADGANSATRRMRIIESGNVGIGILTPAAQLHIDQSSTTAAQPVISADQADLSEEFINFITTVGAGNPIDTAAIGTYYGKARMAVNGTFKFVALYNS